MATDDFTGTDGQDITARTDWTTLIDGAWGAEILSNGVTANSAGGGAGDTFLSFTDQGGDGSDDYMEITIPLGLDTAVAQITAYFNYIDASNYLQMRAESTGSTGFRFFKVIGGVGTQIVGTQFTAGNTYRMYRIGETVQCFSGGVQQGSDYNLPTSEMAYASGGGLRITGSVTVAVYDDFTSVSNGSAPSVSGGASVFNIGGFYQ